MNSPFSPGSVGSGALMSPGPNEPIHFLLKGKRTTGTLIRRAGMRLRVQHENGQSWIDMADLVTSGPASPTSGTASPPNRPATPTMPATSSSAPLTFGLNSAQRKETPSSSQPTPSGLSS